SIINADDGCSDLICDTPGDGIATIQAPHNKSATMEVEDTRVLLGNTWRPIDTDWDSCGFVARRWEIFVGYAHAAGVRPTHTRAIGVPGETRSVRRRPLRRGFFGEDQFRHIRMHVELVVHE